MSRPLLILTGCFGAVSVLLGAFGAHALRSTLPPQAIGIYETGVHYLQIHLLAMTTIAVLIDRFPERARVLEWAGLGFMAGCVLFSGSLVTLAITGWTWLGAVTPVGGVAWVAAWLALAFAFLRKPRM